MDAAFLSQEELQGLDVRPPVLKAGFWADLGAGLPRTRYLGLERIEF